MGNNRMSSILDARLDELHLGRKVEMDGCGKVLVWGLLSDLGDILACVGGRVCTCN